MNGIRCWKPQRGSSPKWEEAIHTISWMLVNSKKKSRKSHSSGHCAILLLLKVRPVLTFPGIFLGSILCEISLHNMNERSLLYLYRKNLTPLLCPGLV